MIKYIKLTEILESLNEADSTAHSLYRLYDRVTTFKNFMIFNGKDNIGRANFTKTNLNEIKNNIEKIKNITFDKNKRFAIIVAKLELTKNNVDFQKGYSFKDINEKTYLNNKLTGSNGNILIAIIENDKIFTIMWVQEKNVNIDYLDVDEIITNI